MVTMKMRFVMLGFVLLANLLYAPLARAETINSFDTTFEVNTDGTVTVEEQIQYDFEGVSRHGIFRDIEMIKTNADGTQYRLNIDDIEVLDEAGRAQPFVTTTKKSSGSERVSLKIGDPAATISGQKLYIIRYDVSGAITYFSDHDELYWNITGNDWTVPIDVASATVQLPTDATTEAALRTTCYAGQAGSTDADCQAKVDSERQISVVAANLGAGEGVTFVAGFPKGMVAQLEPELYTPGKMGIGQIVLILLAIVFGIVWYVLLPFWIVWKWYRNGRDPKPAGTGVLSASFDVPKLKNGQHLTPAEVGTLIDEHVHTHDIIAAIVDLARRGYLRIEERAKKDFWLTKIKSPTQHEKGLQKYEHIILQKLFATGDEVRIKTTDLTDMHRLAATSLNEAMVMRGFFARRPDKIRNPYTVLAFLSVFSMNIVLALAALFAGRGMPRKSEDGVLVANQAKSLKNFISSQKRQMEFQALNQMTFEKFLPYAVAFGVEKVWAKRFADVPFTQPSWYSSQVSSHFTAQTFTNSLSSSMGGVAASMTPTSSSTGHSSGFSGGSSGGGGGGGGGGSW